MSHSLNPNTDCVCGDFADPTTPDQGLGAPLVVKLTGEAPTLPTLHTITYDPDATPPFTAS
jgi:hypothetical protein